MGLLSIVFVNVTISQAASGDRRISTAKISATKSTQAKKGQTDKKSTIGKKGAASKLSAKKAAAVGNKSAPYKKIAPRGKLSATKLVSRADAQPKLIPFEYSTQAFPLQGASVSNQQVRLSGSPALSGLVQGRVTGRDEAGNQYEFTVNPALQAFAHSLVRGAPAHHVAIVVMDVRTGKILALAGRSPTISDPVLHDEYPAASMFKVITSAAALERSTVRPDDAIVFRGGTYELERWNYLPDARRDARSLSFADALGKSANPVFGRVALRFLSPAVLLNYSEKFGFNQTISSDINLERSHARIPTDQYDFARTAAGFGDVTISPIHAAAMISGLANAGVMMRPYIVQSVKNANGTVIETSVPQVMKTIVSQKTAGTLLEMMEHTTTIGTSRKQFFPASGPALPGIRVAGKTGTLNGTNPKGLTNWFIGTAPLNNPTIAIAALVVDPNGISGKASYLAKRMFQKALLP